MQNKINKIKTESLGISEQVLNWINRNTHRDNLSEKTTKEVAAKFNLTTNAAYRLCTILADKRLITKLDPVNDNKFDCCGWIRNDDDMNIAITTNEGILILIDQNTSDELKDSFNEGVWSSIVRDKTNNLHTVILSDNFN